MQPSLLFQYSKVIFLLTWFKALFLTVWLISGTLFWDLCVRAMCFQMMMTMIEQAENTIEGRGGNPCGFGEGKWFSNGIITHSTQNYNRAKTMFEKHTSVFTFIPTIVVCLWVKIWKLLEELLSMPRSQMISISCNYPNNDSVYKEKGFIKKKKRFV